MALQTGTILKSTEALNDTYFESSTIIITEFNTSDAIGFIINKPFNHKLNDLEEFKQLTAFPLYEGGPVDQEHLFFIHCRPDLIENGTRIENGIYFGGDFNQAISSIEASAITTDHIKIFIGYCGWDIDQLQEEVDEGSWIIQVNEENIFITN